MHGCCIHVYGDFHGSLHDLSMDIPWHSIYSDHTGNIRTMELTDFMGIPYIPHGIHVFLMEFHEFSMGYS